jgi:hypothetical protein
LLCFDLSRSLTMLQAALSDGVAFDPFSFQQNGVAAPEVDVGRSEVAETFVIWAMVVVIDEGCDLGLKVLREVVVFQQDAVLERLMPAALDLAQGLGMAWSTIQPFDGSLFEPVAKISGDVAWSLSDSRRGLCSTPRRVASRGRQRQVQRVGDVFDLHGGAQLPSDVAARAVSPARRFLPASRNSFDQL